MNLHTFLEYSEKLDLKVLLAQDTEIENWCSTFGIPRNHVKEAIDNLRVLPENYIYLRGFQNALRMETRVIEKVFDGTNFSDFFNINNKNDIYKKIKRDEVIIIITHYLHEIEGLLRANSTKCIFVFLLNNVNTDNIPDNIKIIFLPKFYGLAQIYSIASPYIKNNIIILYMNNHFIMSGNIDVEEDLLGMELFWSISYQLKYMKNFLGIHIINKFQASVISSEQDMIWDELIYNKLKGINNRYNNIKSTKLVAFHNSYESNSNEYLNYPHCWVGKHFSKSILRLRELMKLKGIEVVCSDEKNLDKIDVIIFWEFPIVDDSVFLQSMRYGKKLVLCATESVGINIGNEWNIIPILFDQILTWRENILNNNKINYMSPIYFEPVDNCKHSFIERKNYVIIASIFWYNNIPFSLYKEREKIIMWMEEKHPGELDFYGKKNHNTINDFKSYRGFVDDKLETLSQYKYCICFENNHGYKGYISEKIFDCFFSRCIPIYYGAPDVEDYIPKECFINMRNFKSYEELYSFIETIDEEQWNNYIEAIEGFIKTDVLSNYSGDAMTRDLLIAIDYINS